MKKISFLLLFALFISAASYAQKLRGLDKSPRDVAYFPDNFAHDRKDGEKPLVKVTYSRPFVKGREIFGKLEPFGKVWRTGADESTEIKLYADATIGGKKVKAGTYSLFTIPEENEWTIILSSDLDYWGAYKYKEANDVIRVKVPVKSKNADLIENFTIQFAAKGANEATMTLGWANTLVDVPFKF